MKLGMVGLGKMGGNMAERLRLHGHEVVGFDQFAAITDVHSLQELVARLPAPRTVWVMVPAGDPTESTIVALRGLLSPHDTVIEGGNSFYRDSMRRAAYLAQKGIALLDCGTSGGIWGLKEGYCLMIGGDPAHVERNRPIFEALAQADGWAHVGPIGSGHFTKMVHNGIEYGMMQAYAEGYELLAASDVHVDVDKAIEVWRHGSVIRSWMLDLAALALKDDPGLKSIKGYADDSGEGRWTVTEAVRLAVPVPVISTALFARFSSRQEDSPAMRVVAALRNRFGGHATKVKP